MQNKWLNGALPALLIHISIGSVYCWSLLKDSVAHSLRVDTCDIEIAFSLAIFCLGMSAAFCGKIVEKNVSLSALVASLCFGGGLISAGYAIEETNKWWFIGSYGVLMGAGLGIGYLTPIKTLMLWFKENKGLAAGIAIAGFGLSKVLFSPLIVSLLNYTSTATTLMAIGSIGVISMSTATILIRKPEDNEASLEGAFDVFKFIRTNRTFRKLWFMFFLNITCGLAIISFEKNIVTEYNMVLSVGLVSALAAVFNTIGRIGFATWSDYLYAKTLTYVIILILCIATCLIVYNYTNMWSVLILIMIVNLGYGGGFSSLPPIIVSLYDVKRLSVIHGLVLSAWGVAGICGNSLSNIVINRLEMGYVSLFVILMILYIIAFFITITLEDGD